MRPAIKVGLSTASVYPLRDEAAFAYAVDLGYDGVELMVWAEPLSQNVVAVAELSRRYAPRAPSITGRVTAVRSHPPVAVTG